MRPQFIRKITDLGIIPGQHRILVALSGGPDSVVLTDLISHAGFSFGLAHCDFGLRGQESLEDAVFCEEVANFYQVPIYKQQFDMKQACVERNASVQQVARELRYEYFDLIRRQYGYDFIVTGHHADDSAETFFINLTRGTGLKGLKGIPERNGFVVRPLLTFERNAILNYATEFGLPYRHDSSNQSFKYDRNVIRHKLIPVLQGLNPSITHTIQQVQLYLQQTSAALDDYLNNLLQECVKETSEGLVIQKEKINACKHKELLMFHILHPYGFTSAQCITAVSLCLPATLSGKKLESPANTLYATRDTLIISSSIVLTGELVTIWNENDFNKCKLLKFIPQSGIISINPRQLTLSKSILKLPLTWRNWKQGDRIQPFGMKGSKLVSDVLREHHLNESQKLSVHVLIDADGDILWVAGYKTSEKTRLAESLDNTFIIEYAG